MSGIDYSEKGCELARQNLELAGVSGDIYCSDLFCPPAELLGQFDVVVSFGLVEHFVETDRCVAALSRFVRPGGMLLTTSPNLAGAVGLLQRILGRDIYDKHRPLDRRMLLAAHGPSHLNVLDCDYLFFVNFGVVNLSHSATPLQPIFKVLLAKPGCYGRSRPR